MADMAERLLQLREDASYLAEQGDYAGAVVKLRAMRVLYDTAPDQEKEGHGINFRDIDRLMVQFEKLAREQRTGGYIQQQKIEYRNPLDCSYR